ncbi:hypothetical protein ACQFYA_20825 [Promicromonospora sp. Marseille-Q5078]
MDVLTAAWSAQTTTAHPAPATGARCARCASRAAVHPARQAVSKSFTGYDDWTEPRGTHLCPACTWAYTTPALRTHPHHITRAPGCEPRSRAQVTERLLAGALGAKEALVIPLRPGRKHLVPVATWGHITTDHARVPWTDTDAQLLDALTRLRASGFGSRMLAEPAPPFHTLSRAPRTSWTQIFTDWEQLHPWREPDSPWLPLALHITTPTTTKEALR